MNSLLMLILKDIIIPEMAHFIQSYFEAHNRIPTQKELEAEVERIGMKIIEEGTAFLNRNK